MKRFLDNLIVDLIAAGLMIGMLATGYIIRFPLPPGSNKYLTLWSLTRHEWGDIHFWISLGLLAVVLLHICLHWQWLVISLKRRLSRMAGTPGSPLANGLTTLLVLGSVLSLFGWLAQSNVETITGPREGVCPPSVVEGAKKSGDADLLTSRTPSTGGQPQVVSWSDVYPILERSCLSCHGPKKQRGNFRVDRREDYFGKGNSTPLVVPGKSTESPLIAIVSGLRKNMQMADVHKLPDEQVALLRAWIDAGAIWPERTGEE